MVQEETEVVIGGLALHSVPVMEQSVTRPRSNLMLFIRRKER